MKAKIIRGAAIIALLIICGYTIDIPNSLRTSIKERTLSIETKQLGRQLRLYQINNPQDCRIQHILTRWFNAGYATFPNSEEFQKFYLGIKNLRKDTLNVKNPQVILFFHNPENMKADMSLSKYWEKSDPEGGYFIKIKDELQPSKRSVNSLPAIFIRFKNDSVTKVGYEIKIDNATSEIGSFHIYVGRPPTATPYLLDYQKEKANKTEPTSHVATTAAVLDISVTPNTVKTKE